MGREDERREGGAGGGAELWPSQASPQCRVPLLSKAVEGEAPMRLRHLLLLFMARAALVEPP